MQPKPHITSHMFYIIYRYLQNIHKTVIIAQTIILCERNMKSRDGLAYCLIKLSIQAEFAAGTFLHASEAAFITKSLTDNFIPSLLSISFSSDLNLQIGKMETASYIMVVSGLHATDKTPTYEIPLTLVFGVGRENFRIGVFGVGILSSWFKNSWLHTHVCAQVLCIDIHVPIKQQRTEHNSYVLDHLCRIAWTRV